MDSNWHNSIIWIKNYAQSFFKSKITILGASAGSGWDLIIRHKSEIFWKGEVLRFHGQLSLIYVPEKIIIIFKNSTL